MGFVLEKLEVQETDTSTVVYTREDWVADNRRSQHATRDALGRPRPRARRIPCALPELAYYDAT